MLEVDPEAFELEDEAEAEADEDEEDGVAVVAGIIDVIAGEEAARADEDDGRIGEGEDNGASNELGAAFAVLSTARLALI